MLSQYNEHSLLELDGIQHNEKKLKGLDHRKS